MTGVWWWGNLLSGTQWFLGEVPMSDPPPALFLLSVKWRWLAHTNSTV